MADSSLLWVLYLVLAGIIFLEKKTIGCYQPKSSKISWLKIPPIAYSETSVSIRIWRSESKWFSIGVSIIACLNLVKAFLALGVKNNTDWLLTFLALEVSDFSARIYFLDLAVFWPFSWPLQLFYASCISSFSSPSIWILLSSCFSSLISTEAVGPIAEVVFNIEMSRMTSLLNLWINC